MVDYAGTAINTLGGIYSGLKYLVLMVMFGGGVFAFVMFTQYNIKIRVKELTGGRKIFYDTRAKFDKKQQRLKIWKFKDFAPLPPSSAYNTNTKGKKCLEAYRIDGQYIYGTDNLNETGMSFSPLTSGDREFYINELRVAEERKGFDITQHIPALAGLGVLLIVFVITLVFWGDIMAPAITAQETSAAAIKDVKIVTENLAFIMEDLRQIIKQEQIIRTDSGEEIIPPPPVG